MAPQYTKEELQNAVEKSKNYSQVLIKLKYCVTGNSRKYLKKYIALWSIDISHFDKKKTKQNLDNIFVKDTYIKTDSLKRKLYKENLKQKHCEICNQGEEWRGLKMYLILDHINGDHYDNRLENLRILCPNCNACLPTHCGRHRRKPKQLKGRPHTNLKNRKVDRPSYQDLLKDICEMNFVQIGLKYKVTDNTIRKWIKLYEKYPETQEIK